MAVHRIRRGLDLPLCGAPRPGSPEAKPVSRVGVLADEVRGGKLRALVQPGDRVRRGAPLLEDRQRKGLYVTAPAGGRVSAVHRGDRRRLQSVTIEIEDDDAQSFTLNRAEDDGDALRALLLETGLWTALRERPFERTPDPAGEPHALFVTALDTQPHAPDLNSTLLGREEDFERGLAAVTRLTRGTTFVCARRGERPPLGTASVSLEEFEGPHPSGNVGLHIQLLAPVHRGRSVWHLGAQEVAEIGYLLAHGTLDRARVVSFAGPGVVNPRLLRLRMGANVDDVVADELKPGEQRVVSGSVLHGHVARGDVGGWLGRHHQQISVLSEDRERYALRWLRPGFDRYSFTPVFAASLLALLRRWMAKPPTARDLTTTLSGGPRAIVPIGAYERVMPYDVLPTHLLRAVSVGDLEWAEQLGALELSEEDVALCTFVCPGKVDYGERLRAVLDALEQGA